MVVASTCCLYFSLCGLTGKSGICYLLMQRLKTYRLHDCPMNPEVKLAAYSTNT